MNLLLNRNMKMDYIRICLIVKDAEEDKYRYLSDYFREIEAKVEGMILKRIISDELLSKRGT